MWLYHSYTLIHPIPKVLLLLPLWLSFCLAVDTDFALLVKLISSALPEVCFATVASEVL